MSERPGGDYSEDALVEQPVIRLFQDLHWETANCFDETFLPGGGSLGRESPEEVVLVRRLKPALKKMNPDLTAEVIDLAIAEIVRDRSTMSPVSANREIYQMLKEGVRVRYRNPQGETLTENVKIIDWNNPENNEYFLASQFWVSGDLYKRRAGLVGFVNGIPLVFIELKASHKDLKKAYKDNFRDYKTSIPQLFWYNGIVILSNGSRSVIGTITSEWEHFNEWKRINSEGEEGIVSIETMVRGTCEKEKLLDLLENFTLFTEIPGWHSESHRQEPPVPWGEQRNRGLERDTGEPGTPRGLLAYPGERQELLHDLLLKKEENQVKGVVKNLLEILKREKLVLDWRKRQQTRATVRLCIEDILNHLPEKYDKEVYQQKCDVVYQPDFARRRMRR
ncbi:MAG TPA: type I restriction endonuclease [Methanoregulaceae archaeon]|nr:type I restriction endonuclease [Methanoregulaceae archaeon]HPD11606.1 type I restriction endonuclease [Methanoregulaceae archaeon]HRR45426.1 type I restriction endonuclease [Mesotoga sp.]